MPKRYRNGITFNGFSTPVRHAHWGYLAGEAYNTFTKKQKMAPVPYLKSVTVQDENTPTSVGKSYLNVYVNPKLKGMLKTSIEYRDYYNFEIPWVAGSRKFAHICALGTKGQYLNSTPLISNLANDSNQSWFSLDPTQGQTAGLFVPANTAPTQQKIGVSNAFIKFDLVNLSTLPCKIKFTWYRVKMDTDKLPFDVYLQSLSANQIYTTNFSTNATVVTDPTTAGNEAALGSTTPGPNTLGTLELMPYTNLSSRKDVSHYFHELKSKSITLAGGDIHQLNQKLALNIFQNRSIANNQIDPYLKGSVICIMEMQGYATHLKKPESGPQPAIDEITLSAGKVGIVISRHLMLKPLKTAAEKHDVTYIGRGSMPIRGSVEDSSTIQPNISVQTGQQAI